MLISFEASLVPLSQFATATLILPVFEYGSQFAAMLNHAYSAGSIQIPIITANAIRFVRIFFISLKNILNIVFICFPAPSFSFRKDG